MKKLFTLTVIILLTSNIFAQHDPYKLFVDDSCIHKKAEFSLSDWPADSALQLSDPSTWVMKVDTSMRWWYREHKDVYDTVKVIVMCIDTASETYPFGTVSKVDSTGKTTMEWRDITLYQTTQVYWVIGYEIRKKMEWSGELIYSYGVVFKEEEWWMPTGYLDKWKKPFDETIIVVNTFPAK